MNLTAARDAANGLARENTAVALPCGYIKSGLLVLVYRDDTKDVLDNVQLSVTGRGTEVVPVDGKPDERQTVEVSGQAATTDAQGVGRYLPFYAGSYSITVTNLPDPDRMLVVPVAVGQDITQGQCPVCLVKVDALARPSIKVLWMHDASAVAQATPTLTAAAANAFATPSGGDGVATWDADKAALTPGPYAVTIALQDAAKHQLFDSGGTRLGATVQINGGRTETVVKVRKLVSMKVAVAMKDGTGKLTDVEAAKVGVTWPDDRSLKTFDTVKVSAEAFATAADVPAMTGPGSTCAIASVEMPAPVSGTPVYRFVALTTR
jgi:hypothetical protein